MMRNMNKIDLSGVIAKVKSNLIGVVMIAITFFIARNIYNAQVKETAALNSSIDTETRKNEILGDIKKRQKAISYYAEIVNKKDKGGLASLWTVFNGITRDSGTKVNDIKPASPEELPAYTKRSFDLSITSDDYHALGKFISRTESHPDIYIIESMSVKPKGAGKELKVGLRVSTFTLK